MKYQLIIFDWDGTLYNSADYIVNCIEAAGQTAKVKLPNSKEIAACIGLNYETVLDKLFPNHTTEEKARFTRLYHQALQTNTLQANLFEGAKEVLKTLKARSYDLAVATGKRRAHFEADLKTFGLTDMFVTSRCGDEAPSKPHPQMLQDILALLDLPPSAALMIGDTEYDMQLAQNAGVDSIAALYGVHDQARLKRFPVVGMINRIQELLDYL